MKRLGRSKGRHVITSMDIKDAAARGTPELRIPAGAIVSAEAHDEARRRGIALIEESGDIAHIAGAVVAPPRDDPSRSMPGPASVSPRADAVVRGGRVALPGHGLLDADVLIGSGRILALGTDLSCDGMQVDAGGLLVMPGAIDPHVHLGLFGPLDAELRSEGASAVLGGVTTIGWFIGGSGSHLKRLEDVHSLVGRHSPVDVIPHLVLGEEVQLREIPEYVKRGVRSFKVYMCGLPGLIEPVSDGFLMDVFEALSPYRDRVVLCIHAENESLVERALRGFDDEAGDAGGLDTWAETHPPLAEEEAVRRACLLSRDAGVKIYFVHISSGGGLEALRRARAEDQDGRIVAETTSPYLMSPPSGQLEAACKMVPPLRGEATVRELWLALSQGIIDTIGTDNVTMTSHEKNLDGDWKDVFPGYPALGTHLPVLFDEGYHRRGIDLMKIVSAVTRRPAEVFGLYPRKGTLLPGSDADLAVIDLEHTRTVKAEELGSRSDFSIAEGRVLKGWPAMTMRRGRISALFGQVREIMTGEMILRRD